MTEKVAEPRKREDDIEADTLCRQAIDREPDNLQIWNAYGEMNYEAGDIITLQR